jgi:hypothetical protein
MRSVLAAEGAVHFSLRCLSKLIAENAPGLAEQWNTAHPWSTRQARSAKQARLRAGDGEPLVEQADAVAPALEVLATFQGPVTTGADIGGGTSR